MTRDLSLRVLVNGMALAVAMLGAVFLGTREAQSQPNAQIVVTCNQGVCQTCVVMYASDGRIIVMNCN